MNDFPPMIVPVDHTAPVPRRIRAMLGNRCVLDTTDAVYLWEWPGYPAYYIPIEDVVDGLLHDTGEVERQSRGPARIHRAGHGLARRYDQGLVAGRVTFDWAAMDAWFEEDDQVWVHPRSPYHRVDPMRSSRHVKVELNDIVLAESSSTVTVFETGLPTRYYFPRHAVNFEDLTPSPTRTQCPYKGRTSEYWSSGDQADIAWSYDFPTVALRPVTGLVAFLNEQVDLTVDGVRLDRVVTHFSR
ncbi:DUF427 domain-containing protein [Kribbella sandramycini]|uniref:DUF427 domain-containing protein n=1 Tax=Kribbella sandramycini TaxID=60450 RepID=A0A7Y4KVS1_9ACTN|nr:DUF427 domain-containing protein [Kribbella sandramycini]MBB6567775.1 uncharacterized protein (DUF427 family) [Kribbella sandramycini]NOL39629.1 DUF427 domain-containing protein [Kribbella sandramycini]